MTPASGMKDVPSPGSPAVYILDKDTQDLAHLLTNLQSKSRRTAILPDDLALARLKHDPAPACVLAVFRAPESKPTLRDHLDRLALHAPIIYLLPDPTLRAAAHAFHAGAYDAFDINTPIEPLLASIDAAHEAHAELQHVAESSRAVAERHESLSPREREVLTLVVSGSSTRQIADTLGRREKTIEFHRRNIMHKMQAPNIASLVRMIVALENPPRPRPPV